MSLIRWGVFKRSAVNAGEGGGGHYDIINLSAHAGS